MAEVFAILKQGYKPNQDLKKELKAKIRKSLSPIIVIGNIHFVSMIPKTRSGKIMRRILKAIATGNKEYGNIATLANPGVIEELKKEKIK